MALSGDFTRIQHYRTHSAAVNPVAGTGVNQVNDGELFIKAVTPTMGLPTMRVTVGDKSQPTGLREIIPDTTNRNGLFLQVDQNSGLLNWASSGSSQGTLQDVWASPPGANLDTTPENPANYTALLLYRVQGLGAAQTYTLITPGTMEEDAVTDEFAYGLNLGRVVAQDPVTGNITLGRVGSTVFIPGNLLGGTPAAPGNLTWNGPGMFTAGGTVATVTTGGFGVTTDATGIVAIHSPTQTYETGMGASIGLAGATTTLTGTTVATVGNSTVSGNQTVQGNLAVNGNSQLGNAATDFISHFGTTILNGPTLAGDITQQLATNRFTTAGTVSIGSDPAQQHMITGDVTFAAGSDIISNANATFGTAASPSTVTVNGFHNVNGTQTVGTPATPGALVVNGTANVTGNATIGDSGTDILTVNSDATFTDDITQTGAGNKVNLAGTVTLGTDATQQHMINGDVTLSAGSDLNVGGATNLAGNTTIGTAGTAANLEVNGSTTLGRVGSNDLTTMNGNVDIALTTGQTFNVGGGPTIFDGNVSVGAAGGTPRDLAVTGNTTLEGNLTANGNTAIGNAATDTLMVTATSTFSSPVSITGDSTYTGAITMGNSMVNKTYVDTVAAQGFTVLASARLIALSPIALSGLPIIDGVQTVAGDRIVVAGQVDLTTNGIYTAAAGAWAKTADSPTLSNRYVNITMGVADAGTGWVSSVTMGNLTWNQFSSNTNLTASNGVLITNNNITLVNAVANRLMRTSADNTWTPGQLMTADITDAAVTGGKIANTTITQANMAANSVGTGQIIDQNVTTAKIADSNVTLAKMASNSVGTAQIIAQAVTNSQIADQSVTQSKMAANSVGTGQLIDLNVTTAKIANKAVTQTQIADLAVGTPQLIDQAVTTAKIANQAVTQTQIANLAVGTSQLIDQSVTQGKIANLAVGSAQIAENAIVGSKIAAGVVTNDKLANSSLTVTAGTGLTGGGVVALGGSVTLNVANALPTAPTTASQAGYVPTARGNGTVVYRPQISRGFIYASAQGA